MSETEIYTMDIATPYNVQLTGFYTRSFAHYTIKERIPVILTQMIDRLVRSKDSIIEKYGPESDTDIKNVIGAISKFKYEIQTNKPITDLESNEPDTKTWNRYIMERRSKDGNCTHFNTVWLFQECYIYRRLHSMFENTAALKDFDPFREQKIDSFNNSIGALAGLASYYINYLNNVSVEVKDQEQLVTLLKLNLWGNKNDLSLSLGFDKSQEGDPMTILENNEKILVDKSSLVYDIISKDNCTNIIDIVLDNAGYEVFTDFCLADFLISRRLAKKVRFYVKRMPWYISDVTEYDFNWVIKACVDQEDENLSKLGQRWTEFVKSEQWTMEKESFWTLPFDFSMMKSEDPALYSKLAEAKLIFFKGDLNYRKLLGEVNWEPTTPFSVALQGFHPSGLCTLRTVKADLICGLEKGTQDKLDALDPDWMRKGDYGVIQCTP